MIRFDFSRRRPSIASNTALLLIVTLFIIRGLAFADFIPIWDGREYVDCLLGAIDARSLLALNCFGHPTMAYMAILAIPGLILPGSYPAILVTNLGLGAAAIVAFHWVLGRAFPEPERRIDLLLLSAAFSTTPLLLASALNPNPDYGVFAFFVFMIGFLLARREWPAIVCGMALCFAKETGVFLYLAAICCYWLTCRAGTDLERPGLLATILPKPRFFVPPLLLLGSAARSAALLDSSEAWQAPVVGASLSGILANHLLGVFLLNFAWIPSLLLSAGLVAVLLGRRPSGGSAALFMPNRNATFVLAVLATAAVLLIAVPTYSNPRYYLVLSPLLLAASYPGLCCVVRVNALRRLALLTLATLLLLSGYATIDPLSRSVYGTFQFGTHAMLNMTSRSGECCGFGRDQLQYNLQFTVFHYLLNDVLADLKPSDGTQLIAHPSADWHLAVLVDPVTFQRTLTSPDARAVKLVGPSEVSVASSASKPAYYINFPNFPDTFAIPGGYIWVGTKRYDRGGYWVEVRELLPTRAGGDETLRAADTIGSLNRKPSSSGEQ